MIHSEFTARLAYVLTNLGALESHLVELRRAAKLARAQYTLRHKADRKYELDAEMLLDPEIKKIEDTIAEEEDNLKLLNGLMNGYVKIVEGSSREITRRENEKTSRGD